MKHYLLVMCFYRKRLIKKALSIDNFGVVKKAHFKSTTLTHHSN